MFTRLILKKKDKKKLSVIRKCNIVIYTSTASKGFFFSHPGVGTAVGILPA
jgi:hypothetical protein